MIHTIYASDIRIYIITYKKRRSVRKTSVLRIPIHLRLSHNSYECFMKVYNLQKRGEWNSCSMATVQIYEKIGRDSLLDAPLFLLNHDRDVAHLSTRFSLCSLPLHSSSPARNNGARCLEVIPAALHGKKNSGTRCLLRSSETSFRPTTGDDNPRGRRRPAMPTTQYFAYK